MRPTDELTACLATVRRIRETEPLSKAADDLAQAAATSLAALRDWFIRHPRDTRPTFADPPGGESGES